MSAAKTLFITGVSSGFGQALAKEALAHQLCLAPRQ